MAYKYYNLTNMTASGNQTTILTFVQEVNNQLNYVPATLILIAIFVVILSSLIGRGINVFKSFAASSFAGLILAIILYGMSLISGYALIVFAILMPVSMFLLWVWGGETIG